MDLYERIMELGSMGVSTEKSTNSKHDRQCCTKGCTG